MRIHLTQKLTAVLSDHGKNSISSRIQTKGRSDMQLRERPDDGPHPIQLHEDKRAKRNTQTLNKQITGQQTRTNNQP